MLKTESELICFSILRPYYFGVSGTLGLEFLNLVQKLSSLFLPYAQYCLCYIVQYDSMYQLCLFMKVVKASDLIKAIWVSLPKYFSVFFNPYNIPQARTFVRPRSLNSTFTIHLRICKLGKWQ